MRLAPARVALVLAALAVGACGDSDKPDSKPPPAQKRAPIAAGSCAAGTKQPVTEFAEFVKKGIRVKGDALVLGCVADIGTGKRARIVGYRLGRPPGEEGSDFCILMMDDESGNEAGPTCDATRDAPDDDVVRGGGDVDLKSVSELSSQTSDGKVYFVYGTASERVEAMRVHFTRGSEARSAKVPLVRVTSPEVLSELGLEHPFGWYVARARGDEITALESFGKDGKSLGKASYRELLDRLPKG
jgi:hypothetical protein